MVYQVCEEQGDQLDVVFITSHLDSVLCPHLHPPGQSPASRHHNGWRLGQAWEWADLNIIHIVPCIVVVGHIDVVDIVVVVIVVIVVIVVVAVGIVDKVGCHRGSRQHKVDEGKARDGASWSTVWLIIVTLCKLREYPFNSQI